MGPAYLDYAASTPMRPEAAEAMQPFLAGCFANPSGIHRAAQAAKTAVEEAREVVAAALGAQPGEIVFTGGGTEADNLAVEGAARAQRREGRGAGVAVAAFEHKAVLAAGGRLADEGFDVRSIRVGGDGVVDLASLEDAVGSDTVLVSVMLVNNEVGTIQPLADVARVVRARAPHAVLHTDAVQAVPWLDMSTAAQAPDLVSISGHKFGGPKGVGALVVRQGVPIVPLLEGGGQERGWRAGTVNVPGVVALATALQVAQRERVAENRRVGALRDRLQAGLLDTVAGAFVNGDPNRKVAGNCHVGFPEVEAESLLVALDQADVYAAAGSSCSSGATEPSHVLAAMGVPRARALASIRLSLGFASTEEDVDRALEVIPGAVADLRAAARVAS